MSPTDKFTSPKFGSNKRKKGNTPGSARKKLNFNHNYAKIIAVVPKVKEGEEHVAGFYLLLDGIIEKKFGDIWFENKTKKEKFCKDTGCINWVFKQVDVNKRPDLLVKGTSESGRPYFYTGRIWELEDTNGKTLEEAFSLEEMKQFFEGTILPCMAELLYNQDHAFLPVAHPTEFLTIVPAWSHILNDDGMYKMLQRIEADTKMEHFFQEDKGHLYSFFDIAAGHLTTEHIARWGLTKDNAREEDAHLFPDPIALSQPRENESDEDDE